MPPTRGTTGELQDLQRSLRDLVALSTLPAVWAKTSPTNIVGSLAEVLQRALSLDFVYVHAHREEGATLEAVRTNRQRLPSQTAQSFGQTLSPWLKSDALGVHSISNPCGSGAVRLIVLSLGHGAHGFVAAGSARPDFPTETEQLLLRVGANQAEIVLERRWADEALRESQQRLQATYYCAPVGIAETSPEGKFVKVNEELCRTLGYNQDELLQRSIEDVTHAEDCSLDIDLHRQLIAGEIPSYQIEKRFVRKDGSIVWTEIRRSAVRDAEGAPLYTIGALRDITERKRAQDALHEAKGELENRVRERTADLQRAIDKQKEAEAVLRQHQQELQSLAGRLITAQEDERRRIARDLHDDLSQRLALHCVQLDLVSQSLPANSETAGELARLRSDADDLTRDVRRISHNLHHPQLALGLQHGASSFCREFSGQYGITVELTIEGDVKKIPETITIVLFRVLQESLGNVAKHSGAERVTILLRVAHDQALMRVTDSGRGIGTESLPTDRGLGLISMRERLRLVGGAMSVNSYPGQGTDIEVVVPMTMPEKTTSASD